MNMLISSKVNVWVRDALEARLQSAERIEALYQSMLSRALAGEL